MKREQGREWEVLLEAAAACGEERQLQQWADRAGVGQALTSA